MPVETWRDDRRVVRCLRRLAKTETRNQRGSASRKPRRAQRTRRKLQADTKNLTRLFADFNLLPNLNFYSVLSVFSAVK